MAFWQFRCFHCEAPLALAHHGFCCRCYRLIEQTPYCSGCGALLRENAKYCGQCVRNELKWHHIVQVAPYKTPLSHWIHRFKYHDQYWLDQPLARLLLLAVRKAQREHDLSLPEVLLPVPLFWQRQWKRGFNQAELLCQQLSHWLKIPTDKHSLQRIRPTTAQQSLTAAQRRRNLKGAFRYTPKAPYQRVAIIYDVVTTGATLNVICAELLKHGVQEIQVWTLARA